MSNQKYVIIQGSSKSKGNTRQITDYILSKKEGHFIDLKTKEISYFDYDHVNINDDFIEVIESILNYETIIFATPVYWYNMSAVMKTFFDRVSDLLSVRKDLGRQLKGKKMMAIACSSDKTEYPSLWESFRLTADYLDMEYLGNAHVWVNSETIPAEVQSSLDQLIGKL